MSEPIDLDTIEARASAATPGPWEVNESSAGAGTSPGYWLWGPDLDGDEEGNAVWGRADAAFVAHAREDVPALVAEVRRLSAWLELIASTPDLAAEMSRDAIAGSEPWRVGDGHWPPGR